MRIHCCVQKTQCAALYQYYEKAVVSDKSSKMLPMEQSACVCVSVRVCVHDVPAASPKHAAASMWLPASFPCQLCPAETWEFDDREREKKHTPVAHSSSMQMLHVFSPSLLCLSPQEHECKCWSTASRSSVSDAESFKRCLFFLSPVKCLRGRQVEAFSSETIKGLSGRADTGPQKSMMNYGWSSK